MCGVTYVGQIEHEYMHGKKLSVCANCLALGFQKPLKRCNGCMLIDYCSKEYAEQPLHIPMLTPNQVSESSLVTT